MSAFPAERLRRMLVDGRVVSGRNRNRWLENRAMFRGDQWLMVNRNTGAVRLLAHDSWLRSGRRRDVVNRILPLVEGRVAQYAVERPPFEVEPAGVDEMSKDGALQAERLCEAMWGETGWNVKSTVPELARAAEVDGVAFLYVGWNPSFGPSMRQPVAVTDDGPVTDLAELNALQQMDPEGESLWHWEYPDGPLGDVEWRIVRPGALAVDPIASASFRDADWVVESRVLSVADVEGLAGRSLRELRDSEPGVLSSASDGPSDVNVDDGDVQPSRRVRDSVIVHELFHRPTRIVPKGAHMAWIDDAPSSPLFDEPWEDELPYREFIPRPSSGHFFDQVGTVDLLKPIQRRFNRVLSLLHEWLDRVARPPLLLYRGSMASDSLYNERGFVELNPGFQEPHYFQAPSEPSSVLTMHLQWMEQQMAEIAAQPSVARGQAPNTVESAAGLQLLLQQTEQQLSTSTSGIVGIYEWGMSRALQLVGRNYVLPRAINAPGVSDSLEFAAFRGEMLAGAHRLKVTGSVQPVSRAAEMQGLMQLAPIIGNDIRPFVSRLISGDTTDFKRADDVQRRRQRRKNKMLAVLPSKPQAPAVYGNFEQDKQRFLLALQTAAVEAQRVSQETGEMVDPQSLLAQRGITPPSLLDALQQAGVDIPTVEDYDDPVQQMGVLDGWRASEEFERMPKLVHQAAREYAKRLMEKMASQMQSMGMQDPNAPTPPGAEGVEGPGQASPPAEKGTPSPPKEPAGGGGPLMRVPEGG